MLAGLAWRGQGSGSRWWQAPTSPVSIRFATRRVVNPGRLQGGEGQPEAGRAERWPLDSPPRGAPAWSRAPTHAASRWPGRRWQRRLEGSAIGEEQQPVEERPELGRGHALEPIAEAGGRGAEPELRHPRDALGEPLDAPLLVPKLPAIREDSLIRAGVFHPGRRCQRESGCLLCHLARDGRAGGGSAAWKAARSARSEQPVEERPELGRRHAREPITWAGVSSASRSRSQVSSSASQARCSCRRASRACASCCATSAAWRRTRSSGRRELVGSLDDDREVRPLPVRLDPSRVLLLPLRGRSAPVSADHEAMEHLPAATGAGRRLHLPHLRDRRTAARASWRSRPRARSAS